MFCLRVFVVIALLDLQVFSIVASVEESVQKVQRNRFPVTLRRKLSQQAATASENGGGVAFADGGSNNVTDVENKLEADGGFRNGKSIRNSGQLRRSSVADYGIVGNTLVTTQSSSPPSRPTPSYLRQSSVRPTESFVTSSTVANVIPDVVTVTLASVTSAPSSTFVPILEPTSESSDGTGTAASIVDGDGDGEVEDEFRSRLGLPAPTQSTSRLRFGDKLSPVTESTGRMGLAGTVATNRMGSRAMKYEEEENVVTDFVFSDIKCYRTKQREFFGASIYMKRGYHVPYIRDRPQDPLTSSDCKMERLETPNGYRMAVTDLRGCGVEQCGDSLCLTMVFPRVPTLALADDEVTTIKCLPQKSSISETRTISFAGDSVENRRSSSTVEGGGQDFAAEVGVFRQNPGTTNGLFVKRVNSGGVVQLGEPLQLRSVVRGGDGWSHSKLTDVKVWRMRDNYGAQVEKLNPSDASEVITLVDGEGCRNPEYDVIAESHPIRDPRNNLVHHFTFRAFLFRGQRANEPLIITAKVQACQEAAECRISDCGASRAADPNVSRYKRSPVEHHNASSIIQDFNSQLALRVVGLRDHPASLTENDLASPAEYGAQGLASFTCTEKMGFAAAGGSCVTLFLMGIAFTLICYHVKNKEKQEVDRQDIEAKKLGNPQPRPVELVRKPGPNKPLPPTPVEYDPVAISNDVRPQSMIKPESSKFSSEYESIRDRKKSKANGTDDGVVIVYCYDKKRKNGSNSAPSSIRSKRRSREKLDRFQDRFRSAKQEDDTEESDGFYATEKTLRMPRTVREVKRNHHKQRRMSIRRRLSSFYREMNGARPHRSFPARISVKNMNGGSRRGKIYYASPNERDICDYSDGLSPGSSDTDSAYAGSECSKHKNRHGCGEACQRTVKGKAAPTERSVVSTFPSKEDEAIYGNLGDPSLAMPPKKKPSHLVSTSESSTKIIILPETNV